MQDAAQSLSVKRAQVDFHNFASLGEPERALAAYADENMRRAWNLRSHRDSVPALTPFLEAGANARLAGRFRLDRPGLFVLEAAIEDAADYTVEILVSPTFLEPDPNPATARTLSVNISLPRLLPRE